MGSYPICEECRGEVLILKDGGLFDEFLSKYLSKYSVESLDLTISLRIVGRSSSMLNLYAI